MRRFAAMLLALTLTLLLAGCAGSAELMGSENDTRPELVIFTDEETEDSVTETEEITQTSAASETEEVTQASTAPEPTAPETAVPDTIPEDEILPPSVDKDGSYTTPEDVAAYIHTFGTLPGNFLTKREAMSLGWDSSKGNLWDVAPDMSIGGDTFGNREGLLPAGSYHECDVNYAGGYRGAERLVFDTEGNIYYTNDHYQSFTQLY